MAAIRFQLGLAGPPRADTAAEPGHGFAHAGELGKEIPILCKLDLQTTLGSLCPLGKDIQDQGAAVQDRTARDVLQGADLAGGKLVIKYDHVRLKIMGQVANLLGLPLTHKAVRVRRRAFPHFDGNDERTQAAHFRY